MRNIATIACAMLVLGVAVQRASADELPNLKDPTMISAGHALFLDTRDLKEAKALLDVLEREVEE